MHVRVVALIAVPLFLSIIRVAGAQTSPSDPPPATDCDTTLPFPRAGLTDPYSDFARSAELVGAAPLRPRMVRRASDERRIALCSESVTTPWAEALSRAPRPVEGALSVELLPVAWRAIVNTAYPVDQNNGALWAGRGYSHALSAGLTARWGPVSAAFAPQLVGSQNRDFEFVTSVQRPGFSPYINPWHPGKIDWPQRPGDQPVSAFDLGQSYLRVDAYALALGISTENLWWGPALRNPLLMSNTAPGFPHLFLGSSRPIATPVGRLEAQLVWGRLAESDHFDGNHDNDHRLFAGMVVDYEPRGLPGLYLGAARVYMRNIPPAGLPLSTWLVGPYRNVRDNPLGRGNPESDNQLFSLMARWAHPASGFEVYGEWAREDHWADFTDLMKEPDHSQAYMLGFQKLVTGKWNWLRLYGEMTHLGTSAAFQSGRGRPSFYTHSAIIQGYTHRGRLLGAAIGPGSDAQILGVDCFTRRGVTGLFVERVRRDDDAYYTTWARHWGYRGHDVELATGVRQLLFLGDFHLDAALAYRHRYNRTFLGMSAYAFDLHPETNWTLQFGASWLPGSRSSVRAPVPVSAEGGGR